MAEQPSQDRTEPASPKRLKEAADKGQIARSRELTTVVMLLAGTGGMIMLGERMVRDVAAIAHASLSFDRTRAFDANAMVNTLQDAAFAALTALTPLMVILVVAASLAPMALGGLALSSKALRFNWSKLDPIKGLGRVFAWRGLMELAKSLIKFVVVIGGAVLLMYQLVNPVLSLALEPLSVAVGHAGRLLSWSFLILCLPLLLVVAVDVPFQLWDHARQLKMTKQEVKDEQKETDGNPQVKGRQRDMQREIARSRMMAKVPTADVIVTNPAHFAVALKYDHAVMRAPVLVAKGADLIALQIRQIGGAASVPIVTSPLLARSLYHTAELDQEIPVGLYRAVAQVLAHVFRLRDSGKRFGAEPIDMADVPVPQDFQHY